MLDNHSNIVQSNRDKNRIAALSVTVNVVLLISKLVVGLLIGSVSVISEGIHSGIDLIAAVIAFISVRLSSRPPDADHYYGHGKFENISGAIQAILILLAALLIIYESYLKLVSRAPVENPDLGIIIMVISSLANLWVGNRMLRIARRTESIALETDAWHHRTDVLTSAGILAGLIIIRFTGLKILDPIMAIIVALFILRTGFQLVWKSVRDLIDVRLPLKEEERIRSIIQKYSGSYFDFHEMRTRRAGADRFIDFHLVVCKDANIEEAHDLTEKMEKEIIQEFPRSSITIHLEPCETGKPCGSCDKTPPEP